MRQKRGKMLYHLLMLATLATASTHAPPTNSPVIESVRAISPDQQRDLECFALMSLAVSNGDASMVKVGEFERWYFLGRLDGADLARNVKQTLGSGLAALKHESDLKALGSSCDAAVNARVVDLRSLGDLAPKPPVLDAQPQQK